MPSRKNPADHVFENTAEYTPLSDEEIAGLIKTIMDPEQDTDLVVQARNRIATSMEGWMKKKISVMGIQKDDDFEECVQECYAAILDSINKYDPGKGVRPITYFTSIIINTISTHKKNAYNMGVTSHKSVIINCVRNAVSDLSSKGIDQPTVEMIAIKTNYSIAQVLEALNIINSSNTSLADIEGAVYAGMTVTDVFNGKNTVITPEIESVKKFNQETIQEALSHVDQQAMVAFLMHNGLCREIQLPSGIDITVYGDKKMCYKEIGDRLGGLGGKEVSAMVEKVRRTLIENAALRDLYDEGP